MKTIIGLGNPGKEYDLTRHNIGREITQAIGKKFGFTPFMDEKKYFGLMSKGVIAGDTVTLLLPETFMNKSGKAVMILGPAPKNLIVIHDDADLLLGNIKISFGKNDAGHRGVKSVMRAVGTKDFWRIRIGIQKKKRVSAEKLVLKKWTPTERAMLKKVEKKVFELIEEPLATRTVRL